MGDEGIVHGGTDNEDPVEPEGFGHLVKQQVVGVGAELAPGAGPSA